jgi:hypothetical protein
LNPLLNVESGSLTVDFTEQETQADGRLVFADAAQAEKGTDAVQTAVGVLKQQLAAAAATPNQRPLPRGATPQEAFDRFTTNVFATAATALRTVRVTQKKNVVEITLHSKPTLALGSVLEGIRKTREAANRQRSMNNLKQIALAMHNYAATYDGRFPPPAITSKDGTPLLSWRVAILPYIEQHELYRQFHLDEPWDSEHNKKLLAKMPLQYLPTNVETKPYTTFYRVFAGKGSAFDNPEGNKIQDFTDGTSNTILVVEAGDAVPWTKPDPLPFGPNVRLPKLGGETPGQFLAAYADGSVHGLPKNIAPDKLRALITRNGGEIIEGP